MSTVSGVSYRERCSQFPVLGAVVATGLLAGGVAGLVAVGGPNGRAGAGGAILLAVALLAFLYLLLALLDLPNGIEIGGGRFAVGARGVRPAGRLWRLVGGPLDAVRSWGVLSARQASEASRQRPARSAPGPAAQYQIAQYLGDLRLLRRGPALFLVVDAAAVTVRFPARLLVGYLPVPAGRAGAVWDGVVLIGTRRPAALAAALEQALPGRRESFPRA